MLVADHGVALLFSSFGNVRISDLTIVNSQVGLARATGFFAPAADRGVQVQLHAVHVSGAGQIVAISELVRLEILDSDIIALKEDTTGVAYSENSGVTLERSHIAAEVAFGEEREGPVWPGVRISVLDSHLSGRVFIDKENSRFEAVRSSIAGDVSVSNDGSRIVLTSSSVTGRVSCAHLTITDTDVEGSVYAYSELPGYLSVDFDGLRVHGEVTLRGYRGQGTILRSHISSPGTAAALSLRYTNVQLKQTFVQGALALAAVEDSGFQSSSSVLAGPVSADVDAVLSCAETYGADYELLTASCQPQAPYNVERPHSYALLRMSAPQWRREDFVVEHSGRTEHDWQDFSDA